MRKLSLITLLTAGLLATTGCSGDATSTPEGASTEQSAEDIGTVLATVNGMKIGSVEFESVAARQAPADGKALSAEERKEVLDRLINERVLYQEALRKGLDKDDKVKKVMVNTLLREDVYANVRNSDFTDAELEAYFEANKDDFVVPEKVQIKHILVRITEERPEAEAKALAEDIRKRLGGDPANNFRQLAIDFSEDAYARRGGDVGFVSQEGKPGLDQSIVDKAFGMEVGQLSQVFRTDSGFSIVYVAQKRDRMERTFQQMKGSVLRKVKNDRLNDVLEEYVSKLKADAAISIDEAALQAVEIDARGGRPTLPGFTPATPELSGAPAGEVKDLQE
ncbi:MAG: peptidylprolyl isomerase [Myxococcota bacterium]|nr:peptidylprolyl isomerase [Myxococcota bacterium]